ncbi:AAA family ATPase [Ascidiaceihabitans sp.]|uniref:AAA family ATPase n=1 Tax=Ascidiaceihabitans sp. TaxID=1872644 RepID=UPI0032987E90
MIIEANERAFGSELARHLLNPRDNDHVTIHAIDGFVADDLFGAFAEAEAISTATRCKKYLFSVSLNPPSDATVPVEVFEAAIASVEVQLGLRGQPHAIVFHEKNGRRHAHCVWSKIDATQMKAVNLSHYKRKLTRLSHDIYLAQGWDVPQGFLDWDQRDPNRFDRVEAGQAKRAKRDPKQTKAIFRNCWETSDSRISFEAALREAGFALARGDRRGFVAVDADGKPWSLSRWCGVKPKELQTKLGDQEHLPSVEDVVPTLAELPRTNTPDTAQEFQDRRTALVARQREERGVLLERQEARRIAAQKARRDTLPKGVRAIFWKVTGKFQERVRAFEEEVTAAKQRDRAEQQRLIEQHLAERRALDRDAQHLGLSKRFRHARGLDPRQRLDLPADDQPLSKAELLRDPALILGVVSQTKADFNRTDILRALAKKIEDPLALGQAADTAMRSEELIVTKAGNAPRHTTKDYRRTEDQLREFTQVQAASRGVAVSDAHVKAAMQMQDRAMQREFGGKLSDEQRTALRHVLDGSQLASVVGLAGAGKSTMLATANDAWTRQGIKVHGAALAGKAADGLQDASSIPSRTLASLELSWKNGFDPIAAGDVLVVDEAGMIGTRQMARVASKLNDIGAKLVLVGDPDQLQPIEAGTPFRDVVRNVGAAHLTEIHRQREDWQKQASRDLAEGRIETAVQSYRDKDAVAHCDTGDAAIEALVAAYTMDTEAEGAAQSRMAFAHRRKDVHALNQSIRAALRDRDDPQPETLFQTETGKRAFATGDRLVFGRNDRDLGVKNGMLGTVEEAEEGRITVALDGVSNRKVKIDPQSYRHFDHGYAVTIHKSQGATVDQAYVLASRTMDKHLAYVAMTRHRYEMRLFVNGEDRPNWMQSPRPWVERRQSNRNGPSIG